MNTDEKRLLEIGAGKDRMAVIARSILAIIRQLEQEEEYRREQTERL